ncbi:lipopolysaccharide-induced tumor necrosis factor-alpha factor homolog [Adelges cooleyi]|uniref:lipopolysaccharide-induced tumor necrosis factor-alpha factor homolog n=1 Tax=Adelges cooleyi TaxID=133065 RepID=UPI0021804B0C|nr:lipopolysaccharide-induced tumor necrosis factor-alpha factor homolog [Adelges cooleyi]
MYPEVPKSEMPSAPPSYSESVGAPPYGMAPNYYPDHNAASMNLKPNDGQQQQPTQVIVVHASAIPPLGQTPVTLICPTCRAQVVSSIREESSNGAYLCCMLLFVVGCALCSCVPFCMDSFKKVHHTCPKCDTFFGTYQP